jgi:lipopolysaccharide/colanic/teichoic acid biosynthesis glycosyltransferase
MNGTSAVQTSFQETAFHEAPVLKDPEPSVAAVKNGVDPFKRAMDVVFSTAGILATSPAWLILPVVIKIEDGGPIFHGQDRVGRGGALFTSWKFRSMKPREGETGPLSQAHLEQDRITRIGRLMRATALDEIPQLWSILRGDMSLVGPRALLPEEIVDEDDREPVKLEEVPGYWERHSVRPGLTGIAQVFAPRDIDHRKKFRYDLLYIRRRSTLLDLILVVRSVWNSLTGAWPKVGKRSR